MDWYRMRHTIGIVEKHVKDEKIIVMIIGLGSVGAYLLDYLVSMNDSAIKGAKHRLRGHALDNYLPMING